MLSDDLRAAGFDVREIEPRQRIFAAPIVERWAVSADASLAPLDREHHLTFEVGRRADWHRVENNAAKFAASLES
jgi:hypothetical protein